MTRRNALALLGLIVLVALVAAGATAGATAYFAAQYRQKNNGCQPTNVRHVVTIQDGLVTPQHTDAQRCDLLTITNQDGTERLIAFGRHTDHVPYDGISERYLALGESLTVTLDQTGQFLFHDHLHDQVQGAFTVK